MSTVATHTRHIGLVATASSTYNSPFNLARRLASLDLISGGRAGWNVVTSFDTGTSKNFGRDEHLDYATRYGRALEFVRVARGLWDFYEDDAFPADVDSGLFLDPGRLHALDHVGEHFKVAGPLNISRSPQGQPVIFRAGVSAEGRDLAARVAEGIYAPGGTLEQAQEYYADIKKRTAAHGRDPDHIKVFIHGGPVVGSTDEEARRREREIFEEDNDFERNPALLGRSFGAYVFSVHDLDAPLPDVAHLAEKDGRTGAARIIERVPEQQLTLRQVIQEANAFRQSPFTGAPDTIEKWYDAGTLDGINPRLPQQRRSEPLRRCRAAAPEARAVPHRVRGRDPARQPRPADPRQPPHPRARTRGRLRPAMPRLPATGGRDVHTVRFPVGRPPRPPPMSSSSARARSASPPRPNSPPGASGSPSSTAPAPRPSRPAAAPPMSSPSTTRCARC